MKKLNLIYTIILFIVMVANVPAQEKVINLDTDHSEITHNVIARDLINLKPGFQFKAGPTTTFSASIDNKMICDIDYEEGGYVSPPSPGSKINVIPGSHAVSPGGASIYNVPIDIPPGINGLVPSLSITYNSNNKNGIMGLGWGLKGLSFITRGTKSLLQDDEINSVTLTGSDRFFLDGQRLVCVQGVYGESGSVYKTEIDQILKIELLAATNGGMYFKVFTPNGRIMEYSEKELNSEGQTLLWALKEISDLDGNTISYNYKNTDKELDIDYITYADTRIDFYYGLKDSEDWIFYYKHGEKKHSYNLLERIEISVNNKKYKEYVFNYLMNYGSLLNKISVFTSDGSRTNPTVINWSTKHFSHQEVVTQGIGIEEELAFGDFNGDGLEDFITYSLGSNPNINVYTNSGGNGEFSIDLISIPDNTKRLVVTDIDDDGDDDIYFCTIDQSNVNVVYVAYLSQQGFVADYDISYTFENGEEPYLLHTDFNGDGKSEYILFGKSGDSFYSKANNFSTKGGLFEMNHNSKLGCSNYLSHTILNFNGNALPDILFQYLDNGEIKTVIYEYDKSSSKFESIYYTNEINGINFLVGDFNGDGLSDLCPSVIQTDDPSTYYINESLSYFYYSTGIDFEEKQNNIITCPDDINIENDYAKLEVTDLNADGKSDIVRYYCTATQRPNDNTKYDIFLHSDAYISSRDQFESHSLISNLLISETDVPNINPPPPADENISIEELLERDLRLTRLPIISPNRIPNSISRDFSGNGYGDIMFIGQYLTSNYQERDLVKRLSLFAGQPNLVSSIRDGLDITTHFTYATLNDENVYERTSMGEFPIKNILKPLYVVKKVKQYGSIMFSEIDYSYENMRLHVQHGFVGFESIKSLNVLTNILTTTSYENVGELYVPKPHEIEKRVFTVLAPGIPPNPESLISVTQINNQIQEYSQNNQKYYQLRVASKSHQDYISTAGAMVITEFNNYTIYNQPQEIIETHNTSTWQKQYFTFDPMVDNGYWLPNRLTSQTVTTSHTDETGSYSENTSFNYSQSNPHRLEKKVILQGSDKELSEEYEYEDFGSIKKIKKTNGIEVRSKENVYHNNKKFIITRTVNNEFPVTYTYSDFGKLLVEQDHIGNNTNYSYDSYGNITKISLPNGNEIVSSIHLGRQASSPNGVDTAYYKVTTIPGKGTVKEFYNANGQLLRKEFPGPLNKIFKEDYEYYSSGLLKYRYLPYESLKSDRIYYQYDDRGRLISEVTPQGENTIEYSGNTVTVTSPDGVVEKTIKSTGLVSKIIDRGQAIEYSFSNRWLLKETKYGGNTIMRDHDALGNLVRIEDPDKGLEEMSYNAFGEIETYTNPKGNTYNMLYDNFGRITSRVCGPESTAWNYDPISGNLITEIGNETSISYEYSPDGLYVDSQTETIDGQNFQTSFTYNQYGNVQTITYPGGFSIKNNYDNHGYNIEVKDAVTLSTIWELNAVNDKGMTTNYTYGNGISTSLAYDEKNRPWKVETSDPGIHRWEYKFNNNDPNLEYRKNLNTLTAENFEYDSFSRLVKVNNDVISYEDNGNITSKPDIGTYQYSLAQPHAVSGITSVDESYNPTSIDVIEYTNFDKISKLQNNTNNYIIEFTYGTDRQRKMMKTYESGNLTQTKYYAGSYEKIADETEGTREMTYISVGTGLAAVFVKDFDNSEELYYIHSDYLGSIMALTDENGTKVEEYFYDAWGQRKNPQDWSLPDNRTDLMLDRGFTGHEHIAYFGLINMNGRVYDPELGRFLSPDPFIQSLGNSQNYNRYSYCFNNPLRYIDPSGYNATPPPPNDIWDIINTLWWNNEWNTWSSGSGYGFKNDLEILIDYNNYYNSWGNLSSVGGSNVTITSIAEVIASTGEAGTFWIELGNTGYGINVQNNSHLIFNEAILAQVGGNDDGVYQGFSVDALAAFGALGYTAEAGVLYSKSGKEIQYVAHGQAMGLELSIGANYVVLIPWDNFEVSDIEGTSYAYVGNWGGFSISISGNSTPGTTMDSWSDSYVMIKIGIGFGIGGSASKTTTTFTNWLQPYEWGTIHAK